MRLLKYLICVIFSFSYAQDNTTKIEAHVPTFLELSNDSLHLKLDLRYLITSLLSLRLLITGMNK